MINNKSVLAVIPARGGSKGLPKKNIKLFFGEPLIYWTIKAGLNSKYIDELMVTTDDAEIANISSGFGAKVPFIRPAKLASDKSPTFNCIKHTIDYYKENTGNSFDIIICLEPTSPLRKKADIDNMLEKLIYNETEFDSIVSIGEVSEHPSIMKKIRDNKYEPFSDQLKMTTSRQDNSPAYFPYGVAYIAKSQSYLSEKTFYTKKSTFYLIERFQCYEIDDYYDFICNELIMKEKINLL